MKNILTIAFLVLAVLTSNSQTIGVKGGMNLSNILADEIENDSRISYHLGLSVDILLNEKTSISPELIYSFQGTKYFELDYLNIPVMFKLHSNDGFSFGIGPSIGFLMSDNYKEPYDYYQDLFNNVDYGLNLQINYKLNDQLFLVASYYQGLSNVLSEDDFYEFEDDSFIVLLDNTNSVFQISLGYILF